MAFEWGQGVLRGVYACHIIEIGGLEGNAMRKSLEDGI